MPLIKKFTIVDPAVRASYSLKTSTHLQLKLYDLFYRDTYKEEATTGELVEQMLLYVLANDPDFVKFSKKLPAALQTEFDGYKQRLTGAKSTDEAEATAEAPAKPVEPQKTAQPVTPTPPAQAPGASQPGLGFTRPLGAN